MHDNQEKNHYNTKNPFSKVILHAALQIKLWGAEDLEIIRKNSLSQQTLLEFTKFFLALEYLKP